ncbi:tetratricopeptide repeat protein [Methanococcoides sp. NM1]|uniref:tetratricopeptide repeat protein n=1 Tax=Methanococcoides sp. NM1 TaxID=1201013 RepID=UPI001082D42D|nr:tetratricopeptide repeat protein [Methanococcoides sp. NM1]
MIIGPKHDFVKTCKFVDREDEIQIFKDSVERIEQNKYSVLVYYGVGGIGKTGLIGQLRELTSEGDALWSSIDLSNKNYRDMGTALITLRNDFRAKYGAKFPSFDIAYAIYWQKVNPQIPLSKDSYSLIEEGSIVDDLLNVANNFIPFRLFTDVAAVAKKLPDKYREWWAKHGQKELSKLPEMDSSDIEQMLPKYWAYDLMDHLESRSRSAVIFIDTYEAFWENFRGQGSFHSRDEWLREQLIPYLPDRVLWVICGRESLRWEEVDPEWKLYVDQHKVEGLLETDSRDFLRSCGIEDESVQEIIFNGSSGVPYYLDLTVDTYQQIKENRQPTPYDFAKAPHEVFENFIKYLDRAEKETLKVLSSPRFWDENLFEVLITEFKTGYSLTAFSELNRFSFMTQESGGRWYMHKLMKESLQEYQDQDLKEKVHRFMFEYYDGQLTDVDIQKIKDEHKTALTEGFYHGKIVLEAQELFSWFYERADIFNRAAQWQLIMPLYEEMSQILEKGLGSNHSDVATSLNSLAMLYGKMRNYDDALTLYQQALDIRKRVFGPNHRHVATIMNNLAVLHSKMGNYDDALTLYQQALEILKRDLGSEHPDVAAIMNSLAMLYTEMRNYDDALKLYQCVLEIQERVLDPDHLDVAITLNNLAMLYRKMRIYDDALTSHQRALGILKRVLGSNHPDVATSMNNLAGLYTEMEKYDDALKLYPRALAIRKRIFGPNHPAVATILNNLAVLYRKMGNYDDALTLHHRALEIREQAFGPEHPDVANSLYTLAVLYDEMEKYDDALKLYQRALDIIKRCPSYKDYVTFIQERLDDIDIS